MPWTNASIVLNSRDRTKGTYNNSTFNAERQNIIQGQIDSISVNEVNFPYDIPNIQAGFNSFLLSAVIATPTLLDYPASTPGLLTITIAPGFYSGSELADAITAEISAQQTLVGGVVADAPTCSFDDVKNLFTLVAPATAPPGNPTATWGVFSPFTFPTSYNAPTNKLGKDILSIMGYSFDQVGPDLNDAQNFVSSDPTIAKDFLSGSAPLTFTQYIDICSPQLCKFQFFRDGSTTNLARRADVICRLYIANSVAIQEPEGQRPFVISRQYNNARVMRWTADNSVGTIDIQLYDDVGQPLLTSWAPRPYQITFNCYEMNSEEVGGIHRGI